MKIFNKISLSLLFLITLFILIGLPLFGAQVIPTPGQTYGQHVAAFINNDTDLYLNKQNIMGADENYVTDAEKVVIGNTSGANTGDQTDETLPFTDNTTNDVNNLNHGFAPKGNGNIATFLNGDGAYSVPTGGLPSLADYSNNLIDAVAAIGATPTTLFIADTIDALTANLIIPSTLSLIWLEGNQVSGAFTLTINGSLMAGNYKIFDIATVTIDGSFGGETRNPNWWGAIGGDPANDSTAINACIDSIASEAYTSATIWFSDGIYLIDAIVEIHSRTRISVEAYGATFMPTNNSITMFQYSKASLDSNYQNGGGVFAGAVFTDTFTDLDGPPPANAFTNEGDHTNIIALDLLNFDNALVKDCSFNYINGTAIHVERAIMTNIDNTDVIYCGASGLPAFHLDSAVSPSIAQSFNISDCKIETNYYESYLMIEASARKVKILGGGFESDSDILITQQTYVEADSDAIVFDDCHFGKNASVTLPRVKLTGNEKEILGGFFSGNTGTVAGGSPASIVDSGSNFLISGTIFTDQSNFSGGAGTGYNIDSSSDNATVDSIQVRRGAGVRLTGSDNLIVKGSIFTDTDSTDPVINVTGSRAIVSLNTIDTPDGDGIVVSGNGSVLGNDVFGHSVAGKYGIDINAAGFTCLGNYVTGWVDLAHTISAFSSTNIIENNFGQDEADSKRALKSNVLELDNTSAFTPTLDYHPATKKYTDDLVPTVSDVAFEVKLLATQSNIATGGDVTVGFDSEVSDDGNDFNTTTHTFTTPTTGWHSFKVIMRIDNLDSASAYYLMKLTVSGRVYSYYFTTDQFAGDVGLQTFILPVFTKMTAADTAIVTIYQDSGTAQTDINASTTFSGYFVR